MVTHLFRRREDYNWAERNEMVTVSIFMEDFYRLDIES